MQNEQFEYLTVFFEISQQPKWPDNFDEILQAKAKFGRYLKRKYHSEQTTLIQIFCKILLNSIVIIRSIIDPGYNI